MSNIAERLPIFVEPLALSLMLVYLFSWLGRSSHNMTLRQSLMGLSFGLTVAYSITHPIEISEGYLFDPRCLFISVAFALFGWIAGAIALVIGTATRFYFGGGGATLGIAAMFVSALVGMLWRVQVPPVKRRDIRALIVLGLMIPAHIFVMLFLPEEIRMQALIEQAPYLAGVDIFGAVLIGSLVAREEQILTRSIELEQAAKMDPLTNLMNRRTLKDAVADLSVAKSDAFGRAVIYIDIDHFKQVNDKHGHAAGDQVLYEIVDRIRNQIRPDDLFARIGGDEFAVVLPKVAQASAQAIAQRSCDAVGLDPITADGCPIFATVSMGVYWTEEPLDLENLLMLADAELYRSKALGRNRVCFKSDPNSCTLFSDQSIPQSITA